MDITNAPIESLRWYQTHANHGRGRIVGESNLLLKMGYLSLTWTGVYTWVLTLTPKGHEAIRINDGLVGKAS